jgi:hypothetical protein
VSLKSGINCWNEFCGTELRIKRNEKRFLKNGTDQNLWNNFNFRNDKYFEGKRHKLNYGYSVY